MKTGYYKRGELVDIFNKLPKQEKDIIERFLKYCSISAHQGKLNTYKANLVQFRDIVSKDFDKVELDDLRDFLVVLNNSGKTTNTTNELKGVTKRFLKWYFPDWSIKFAGLEDIRLGKSSISAKINSASLLSKEDIEKIMNTEKRPFWKTFFIVLYETGCRPIEVRLLKWDDIRFNINGDISEIKVFATKTGQTRMVYVKEATFYLNQMFKERGKSPLIFPSPVNENKPLTKAPISRWLKKLSLKALGREVHPYLLRHSRATELYKNPSIADSIAQKFMGHSANMSGVYTHLDSDDVREALTNSVYNFEKLEPEEENSLRKQLEEQQKQIEALRKELVPHREEKEKIKAMAKEMLEEFKRENKARG